MNLERKYCLYWILLNQNITYQAAANKCFDLDLLLVSMRYKYTLKPTQNLYTKNPSQYQPSLGLHFKLNLNISSSAENANSSFDEYLQTNAINIVI